MTSSHAAASATNRILLDPFGLFGATGSRIAGLGGTGEIPHPHFAFHTGFVPLAGSHFRLVLTLSGLRASSGHLTVLVNYLPEDAEPPVRRIAQTKMPLAALESADGTIHLAFEALAGASYAVEGVIDGTSDAAAQALEIALEGGSLAASFHRELSVARSTFLAGESAEPPSRAALVATTPVTMAHPTSQMCTASQFAEPAFQRWLDVLGEPARYHRKQWEVVFILQALDRADMLRAGRRGLGFAVGREASPAIMAARGVDVLATDLPEHHVATRMWSDTDQHGCLEALRYPRYCPDDAFDRHVSFRAVDKNHIPEDLADFDFCWSACAYEHLGSLEAGLRFVERSLDTLRPGGIAVHTSEFNLTSDDVTLEHHTTSLFRRRDMELLALRLTARGHKVARLNFDSGTLAVDDHIDIPPYQNDPHLKMALMRYATTSFGIIVRKAATSPPS